jgi:hypothetical protein
MKWIVKKGAGRPKDRKPLCRNNSAERGKGWNEKRRDFRGGACRQKDGNHN